MGIQGLSAFLKKECPHVIRVFDHNASGEPLRVAIDATLYMCRLFFANERLTTPGDIAEAYLQFARMLDERGLEAVHVCDGPASPLKAFAHSRRADARDDGKEALERARCDLVEKACKVDTCAFAYLVSSQHIYQPRTRCDIHSNTSADVVSGTPVDT